MRTGVRHAQKVLGRSGAIGTDFLGLKHPSHGSNVIKAHLVHYWYTLMMDVCKDLLCKVDLLNISHDYFSISSALNLE